MVPKKKIYLVIFFIILIGISYLFYSYTSKESFSVKTFLLKLNIPIGEEATYPIKIKNNENLNREFDISIKNLDNIAYINDTKLFLKPNEEKDVLVYFKDNSSKASISSGKLIISNAFLTKEIPIIITREDSKSVFSIIISELSKYEEIYPGGKLGIEIKVFDLNDANTPTIKSKYRIQGIEGEILWMDEGNLVVDGSKTEIIDIPNNWPKGDYLFITSVEYKGTTAISGYFFTLSSKKNFNFLRISNANLFILIGIFFIFLTIGLFFYFIKTRDEFLIQLKKQQNIELANNLELIELSKKKIQISKRYAPIEKKKRIRKLKKIKRKIIRKIKKKQAIQKKEIKILKKQHKKKEIPNKLESWRRQGYKMFETEEEIKKITNPEKQIEKWKKQGYKAN